MIREMLSESLWLLLLLQGTACVAAGLAASYLLKHRAARAHQALLTAVLAAVLMPGLYVLARHSGLGVLASRTTAPCSDLLPAGDGWAPGDDQLTTEVAYEPMPSSEELAAETPARPAATIRVPWGAIAVVCWLATTAMLLIRLALRFILGLHLVRTARPLESERLCRAVEQAKSRFGVSGPVHIRCSERVPSPVIWCWARQPVLLMHESASDLAHSTDWAGVFCHELAHWRRWDHVSGLVVEVLTAAFPWHPLLWWARGWLLQLSEQVCDDWVLASGRIGVDYAESLLDLSPAGQAAFVPTVVGKEKAMKERIRRIVKDGCGDPRIGVRWAVAVSVVAVLASVGVALAQRRPAPQPRELEEREAVEPRERPESPDPAQAARRRALDRMLDRLSEQIRDKEAALREEGQPNEERQVLEFELDLLREQARQIEQRLRSPDEPRAELPRLREGLEWTWRDGKWVPVPTERIEREVRIVRRQPPEFEARLGDLKQRRDELAEKARQTEQELKGLRDDQDQEARELKAQLEKLHAQMVEVERQLADLQRSRAEFERTRVEQRVEQTRREIDERVREAVKRQEQLRAEVAEVERELQKRKEQGEGDGPESRELRERLRVLSEKLRAAGDKRGPQERPAITRERRTPEGGEGRTEVRVFKFRQATTPERVRNALQPVLGRAGQIAVDGRTNAVVVTTTPEKMAQVEGIIRELDVPTGNRNLEAEVEELRNQMNGLREQMQQMQKLLEQVAERGRTSETQEMKEY